MQDEEKDGGCLLRGCLRIRDWYWLARQLVVVVVVVVAHAAA